MCQQGFDDALSFLHRNNLISCTRCLAVQSTFIVSESLPDVQDYDPECKECTEHRNVSIIVFPTVIKFNFLLLFTGSQRR